MSDVVSDIDNVMYTANMKNMQHEKQT